MSNEYTGQIRIPPAGSVAFGVLVDNTTGTATLSHPGVLQQTTIATLASQTSFTLAAGSADNDAYNGMTIVVTDASTSTQKCVGTISDYVGSTRTVTLSSDPGIFTMAAGDSVAIIAGGSGGGGVVGTVDANLVSIGGDTQSATDLKDFADAGYDPSTNKVQGVVLVDTATDVTTKSGYSLSAGGIAAIWDAAVSGLTTVGSIGKRIVDYLTGDIFARLGAPAGASIAADIADLPTVAEFEARTLAAANYATAANLATVAGYLDTEIAAILADTNELQTDWADGGRLDLILDARASQTSVDAIDDLLDTEIAAIKSDTAAILLDTGTDGVVVAAGSKTGYSLAGTLTTLDALWAKIQKWLRLGFRKDAAVATDHATELSEINANGGSGAGAFANTTDSLEAIRDRGDAAWTTGGGGGSGSGAYTVTLTVTDDAAAAVQGAIVRISKTGEAYTATTNASGVATFSLDAATWTVAITAGGAYAFTPTTLVVSGDTSQTYSLTDNAPSPPAAPLLSTGYLDCYGTDGAAEEGVDIEIVLKTGPGTAGYGLDTGTATATSAANGRASHSGFVQGATYQARRGPAGSWVTFTVPNAGTFQLPETLGKP